MIAPSCPDSITLSVRVITYNHARFIGQALDSVLMQHVTFPYEIVIGEDCSTDGTREIVVEYQRRHPDRIRLLLWERNLGGRHNFIRTLEACRGKYIALLDGDDYWTSPDKLRRQVDFLERHPDYAICFHDALVVEEDRSRPPYRFIGADVPETLGLADILVGDVLPTTSGVVFRPGVRKLPEWFYRVAAGDWPLFMLNARHGKLRYLNEVLGVYRKHAGGATRRWTKKEYFVGTATMLANLRAELDANDAPMAQTALAQLWRNTFFPDHDLVRHDPTPTEIQQALAHWPSEFPLENRRRQQLLGALCARVAFARLRAGNRERALRWLLRAVRHDRGWLRRWGLWSAAVEACAGHSVAEWMRRQARRLVPGSTRSGGAR